MKNKLRSYLIVLNFTSAIIFIATAIIFALDINHIIKWKRYAVWIIFSFGIYELVLSLLISAYTIKTIRQKKMNEKRFKRIRNMTYFTLNRLAIMIFSGIKY